MIDRARGREKNGCCTARKIRVEYAGAAYWEGRVLESGTKGGAPRSERTVDGEAEAARLLTQGMKALGVRAEELARAPKNLREKQVPAWWLRQRTTVGRHWMSQRLWMGEESAVTRAVGWVKANPDAD